MAEEDKELKAIAKIMEALDSLDGEAKERTLSYVLKRLGLASLEKGQAKFPTQGESKIIDEQNPYPSESRTLDDTIPDIRTLKEQKAPSSAGQMAAIVAYYLSEIAPKNERRDSITTKDIQIYFKQAGYPLPKVLKVTLPNAKFAGYFDSGTNPGSYKLNPVGYNLVTHNLPRQENKVRRSPKKPIQKNKGRKKKLLKKKGSRG